MSKWMESLKRLKYAYVIRAAAVFPLFFSICTVALATEEKINEYRSEIIVNQDGSLQVSETIRVTAAGNKIKRGIYRDFPTRYQKNAFLQFEVPFKVISVKRDGKPEPYHTEQQDNGVRVYIGRKNVRLKPGEYTYEIRYETNFQLGHFDDHDELYWNVTGNGWIFPIERVMATV